MREEAAANEALLIDFSAMEAAKMAAGGGGEASAGAGWMPPGAVGGATGGAGPSWPANAPVYQPFPSIPPPAGVYPGFDPMDNNAPPPPYGGYHPMPPNYQSQDTKPKPAAPPVSPIPPSDEKKSPEKPPAGFNIPPNNLSNSSNNSLPSSTETSPAGGNKPSNMNNLQVAIQSALFFFTQLFNLNFT